MALFQGRNHTIEEDKLNRKDRRAARAEGTAKVDTHEFLRLVGKFIDVANQENKTTPATDLHMAFLYAAARYNAHVGKNVLAVEEHEPFVEDLLKQYAEMLRNHLADPSL